MTKTDLAKSLDPRTSPRPDLGILKKEIQEAIAGKGAVKRRQSGYIVREGDTTSSIAQKMSVSIPELLAANPNIPSIDTASGPVFEKLVAGQVVTVPDSVNIRDARNIEALLRVKNIKASALGYTSFFCPEGQMKDRTKGIGGFDPETGGVICVDDPDYVPAGTDTSKNSACSGLDQTCAGVGYRVPAWSGCECVCGAGYTYDNAIKNCRPLDPTDSATVCKGYNMTLDPQSGQCYCDSGFEFDIDGNCVQSCASAYGPNFYKCTGSDGQYYCVDQTCGGHGTEIDCTCQCEPGYVNGPNGSCVAVPQGAPDCAAENGPGYWAYQDPTDSKWYCSAPCGENEVGNVADGYCYCSPGFTRDQDGKCAPVQATNEKPDCAALHGPGYWAFFDENEKYWYCMAPCEDPNEVPNQKDGNCYCKKGYERDPDSGKCVKKEAPVPVPTCMPDELYDTATKKCIKRCREDEVFDSATGGCQKQDVKTDVETGKKKSSSAGVVLGVLALGVFGGMAAYYSSEP